MAQLVHPPPVPLASPANAPAPARPSFAAPGRLLVYLSLSALGIGWCLLGLGDTLAATYAVVGSLCFLPMAASGIRPHSVFQMAMVLFFMAYVVAPLTSGNLPDPAVPRTLYLVVGFLATLGAGYLFGPRFSAGSGPKRPRVAWPRRHVQTATLALMMIGLVGWLAFVAFVGISLGEFYSFGHRIRLLTNQFPLLYHARNAAIWALWAACAMSLLPAMAAKGRLSRADLLLAAAAFGFLVLLTFPLGQRFYLFIPFVLLPVSLSLMGRRPNIAMYAAGGVAFGLFLGVYSFYRTFSYFEGASLEGILSALDGESFLSLVRAGYSFAGDKLTYFALVVGQWEMLGSPYLGGETYYRLPWLFIPQSLGFTKLTYTDSYLTQLLVPGTNSGLAFGSMAEAFINFGVAGVMLAGLVFGIALRLVDSWLSTRAHMPHVLVWFATGGIFVPFLVVGGLYGVTTLEFLLFTGLSLLLGQVMNALGSRTPESPIGHPHPPKDRANSQARPAPNIRS